MTDDDRYGEDWSRDTQKLALLTWTSFLVAAVMALVFFGFVDPLLLVDAINIDGLDSREFGYSAGFFFFWAGCFSSGWLCLRLARRKRRGPRPIGRNT